MAMMHVRRVCMLVSQSYVNMLMGVRQPDWGARVVKMLVLHVVHMSVCMLYQLVALIRGASSRYQPERNPPIGPK
jgi:hypothetical protein